MQGARRSASAILRRHEVAPSFCAKSRERVLRVVDERLPSKPLGGCGRSFERAAQVRFPPQETSSERAAASCCCHDSGICNLFHPPPEAVRAGTRACEGLEPSRSPMRRFNRVLRELISHLNQRVSHLFRLQIQCRLQSQVTLVQSGTVLLRKYHTV
jgi:hypothetical protein